MFKMLRQHFAATKLLVGFSFLALACGDTGKLASPLDSTPRVKVAPRTATIDAIGGTSRLSAALEGRAPVVAPSFAWESLNPDVATVRDGEVTAIATGEARIRVYTGAGADTAVISIVQAPATVEVRRVDGYVVDGNGGNASIGDLDALGESVNLVALVRDRRGHSIPKATTTWQSLDPQILQVDQSGTVYAVDNGDGRVVAKAGNAADTVIVAVKQRLIKLVVSPGAGQLRALGDTLTLAASGWDRKNQLARNAAVSWTSLSPSVVKVSANGTVTAVGNGAARVVAVSGSVADTAEIAVQQTVATISVNPAAPTLAIGQTISLLAAPYDSRGSLVPGYTITWSSSNPQVAAVEVSGRLIAVNAGNAVITASAAGLSTTIQATVTSIAVSSLSVAPSSANLTPGQTLDLAATARDIHYNMLYDRVITWSSSNTAVATVTSNGRVTAIGGGSTTITATSEGKTAAATINVTAPVAEIDVAPASVSLVIGATRQLSASPKDAAGNTLTGRTIVWSSSNATIASVSSSGLVTAKAAGSATISATSEGRSASAGVTVTATSTSSIARIDLSPVVDTLDALGASTQFVATAYDASGTAVPAVGIQWLVINQSVATIDQTGKVTAKGIGTTLVVAAVSAACADTAAVVVRQQVDSISIEPAAVTVARGTTTRVQAQSWDANRNLIPNATLLWTSDNSSVATVDEDGDVTAHNAGSANIRASHGSKSALTRVTVPESSPSVASVTQNAASDTLNAIGATKTYIATARDGSGTVVASAFGWTSLQTQVATVDGSGTVTAKGIGTALIVATATCCARADTVAVVVRQLVNAVSIQPGNVSVTQGATVTLSASALDAGGTAVPNATITWATSAPAVATVDASGKVTGVSAGAATITASAAGKSSGVQVTVTTSAAPPPPPPPPPSGVFFHDGWESGDWSHTQNSARWLTSPSTTTHAHTGGFAGRSRHNASLPGADIGSGPTEMRFRIAPVNSAQYTKVWMEYYLYVPANHHHPAMGNTGEIKTRKFWPGASIAQGSNIVYAPGQFESWNKGFAIAIPGAGNVGDDGLAGWIHQVIDADHAVLTGMVSYKLKTGYTNFQSSSNATYNSAVLSGAPRSVSGVTAEKIHKVNNHKFFVLWGRAYAATQPPHTLVIAHLYPNTNKANSGDSFLRVQAYFDGYPTESQVADGPGITSAGPGLKRGQWNRVRVHVDTGTGAGVHDGTIKVWFNNDLVINASGLPLWPVPRPGETNTPYPWWDTGYINGWINGGFMEDTHYDVDDFSIFLSNPGW